jgi:hypothetical protein
MADAENNGDGENNHVKFVTEEYRNLLHEVMLISKYEIQMSSILESDVRWYFYTSL